MYARLAVTALACAMLATWSAVAATVDEPAATAPGADLLTSPPRIIASVPPGQTTRATLTVVNRAGSTRTFTVTRYDLAPDPEGETYGELVESGTVPNGAGDWVAVDRPSFRLGPDERTELQVTVRVPPTATGGGHYGAIVVETGSDAGREDAVNVRVRSVSHVLVNVPGATAYRVDLDDLDVRARDGALQVDVELQNVGNIHTTPRLQLQVDGPLGRSERIDVAVPETLPGGRRELSETVALPFPVGRFDVTASARLETDEGGESSARVGPETAWAMSGGVRTALLVLAGVAGVLVPIAWWRRRRELQRYLLEELAGDEDEHEDGVEP